VRPFLVVGAVGLTGLLGWYFIQWARELNARETGLEVREYRATIREARLRGDRQTEVARLEALYNDEVAE
jgi:hypothetical protein